MKINGRLFLALIVALALIPGACAITASTGGGSSVSGSGTAQGNFATNGVQATGFSVASGTLGGVEDHWIADTTGKKAEVYFDVQNAATWTHDYSLTPGGKSKDGVTLQPQSSINAQESLTVTNAGEIMASAMASNYEGDHADAWVHALGGSISNYKNSATATMTQAKASQTANSASGSTLWLSEDAYNMIGSNVATLVGETYFPPCMIQNGKLTTYSGSAIAAKNSFTKDLTIATLSGSISLGPSARNQEGDNVNAVLSTTGSVNGYTDHASATSSSLNAKQTASSITGATWIWGRSNNAENDYAEGSIYTSSGTISNPTINLDSSRTYAFVNPTASTISTTGTCTLDALASSTSEQDRSIFDLNVKNGKITTPNFYAKSGTGISEQTYASIAGAYGTTAEITSHGQNLALAYDGATGSSIPNGQADFKALKTNGAAFTKVVVNTQATLNLLDISSTGFSKTALLLEPFKWEFGDIYGPADSVGSTLESKGYAVTDYSNAGVTWEKVYKLDESTVSVINTHGWVPSNMGGDTYGLAISYTGANTLKSWIELQPYLTTPNGMIILSACDPFNTNVKTTTFKDGTKTTTPGKYTVSKAQASGGFVGSVLIADTRPFLNTLFKQLAAGSTLSAANTAAASSISNRQKLTLQPSNSAYKLQ